MNRVVLVGLLVALDATSAGAGPLVHGVYHEPAILEPARGEKATVHFDLAEPARVTLRVYDARDRLVRSVPLGPLAPGLHAVSWDGRDDEGDAVPAEVYPYTLEAVRADGSRVIWDIADATRGTSVSLQKLHWDAGAGAVRYALAEPARVRIRLGLGDGGPMLLTLLDWVPRTPGSHAEPWDGFDASGVMEFAGDPRLEVVGEGIALSRNAMVVGPPSRVPTWVEDRPEAPRRAVEPRARGRQAFDYAHQPIEELREYQARIVLPDHLPRAANGLSIVSGQTPVQLTVAESQTERLLRERCEAVFYIDGEMAFENEVAFLPVTWTWDVSGVEPGIHFLSANIRSYAGFFGTQTLQVLVAPVPAGAPPRDPGRSETR